MRKFIFLFLFFSIFFNSFAQITFTPVAPKQDSRIEEYDSLKNFLGDDFMAYVGQELYLLPRKAYLREYGYRGFVIDPYKGEHLKSNTFRCCDDYNSKYESMEGLYFDVLSVIQDPNKPYDNSSVFLKLRVKNTSEVVYYKYNVEFALEFPFLVMGYLEKQKEIFISNSVVIKPFERELYNDDQIKLHDIETGSEILITIGDHLKCKDVTIDGTSFNPSLLIELEDGSLILRALYTRQLDPQRIFTKEEADGYILKFGKPDWHLILKGDAKKGFTKEMVLLSLGSPEKIIESGSKEEWIYEESHLFLENGVLSIVK